MMWEAAVVPRTSLVTSQTPSALSPDCVACRYPRLCTISRGGGDDVGGDGAAPHVLGDPTNLIGQGSGPSSRLRRAQVPPAVHDLQGAG